MNKHIVISGLGLIAVAGIGYYMVTADERDKVGSMMTFEESAAETNSMGDGSHDTHASDNTSNEKAFLEHMIPHHKEAIDSARAVLDSSQANSEVNALARSIISTQEKEIADMKSWYKAWYGVEYTDNGSYTPMMRDLSGLTGTELDKAFLEDMIEHHTAALLQVQAVAPFATHPETLALAQTIAETQSNEIITMRILSKQIPKEAE